MKAEIVVEFLVKFFVGTKPPRCTAVKRQSR